MDQRLSERKDVTAYVVKQVLLAVLLTNTIVIPTALIAYGRDFSLEVKVGYVFWLSLVTGSLAAALLTFALSRQSARLFNELADARSDLYRLSHIDTLTGLLNRRGYQARASAIIKRSNNRPQLIRS